jgi:hypothetical protein
VTGDWRKLHNEELNNLYSAPSVIRMTKSWKMRRAGQVARMGKRNVYRISMGESEGKRPQGRPTRWWLNNIKMNLREIEWGSMDWFDLPRGRDQWRTL